MVSFSRRALEQTKNEVTEYCNRLKNELPFIWLILTDKVKPWALPLWIVKPHFHEASLKRG